VRLPVLLLKKALGAVLLLLGIYIGLLALRYEPWRRSILLSYGGMALAWGVGAVGLGLLARKPKPPLSTSIAADDTNQDD
jgi:hypothetical protein